MPRLSIIEIEGNEVEIADRAARQALAGKVDTTSVGAAGGVATLDEAGHVPSGQLDIDTPTLTLYGGGRGVLSGMGLVDRTPITYGFELDPSNSSPSGSVTYIESNAAYTPAHMDFTNDAFDYGSWTDPFFMPTPVILGFDGTEICELDPNDYTKDVDGNDSGITSFDTQGNAMMRWPLMWVSRQWVNGKYQFRVANTQVDSTYQCWANLNAAGQQVPFYTPIYFGSKNDSGSGPLRSLSGQANYVNHTGADEITAAKANGSGWHTERVVDRWLVNDLLVLMGRSLDTQGTFGKGRTKSSNRSAINTGTMDTRGLFWGSTDETSGVKVFGMENWWGNLYRRVAGWVMINGSTQKVKLTTGTEDGSTATDYNTDGTGYITLANSAPVGSSGGFISGWVETEHGLVPKALSGSETTYACDKMYYNASTAAGYAVVGAGWSAAAGAGAFYAALNDVASGSHTSRGAAPSYK